MSFTNDIPFNVADAWLSRGPGTSPYLYTHEPTPTCHPEHDETLRIPERDIFSVPMQPEPTLEPIFPATPATSRSASNASPTEDRGYPYGASPEYTQPYPRDVGYGTARSQSRPVIYSPPFQQAIPISPAQTPNPHRIHRRCSSATHYPTENGSFTQPGFRCEWKGCRYNGAFGRKFELRRHVETQHISPNSFPCPEPRCRKPYNRKDNLEDHMRRAHFYDI